METRNVEVAGLGFGPTATLAACEVLGAADRKTDLAAAEADMVEELWLWRYNLRVLGVFDSRGTEWRLQESVLYPARTKTLGVQYFFSGIKANLVLYVCYLS